MSAVTAIQTKHAHLGNYESRCGIGSRNNVPNTITRNGSYACTAPALRDQGLCISPSMQSFWFLMDLVILHKRARGESEIPATALDAFTDKAGPAWDYLMLVAKRFSMLR